MSTIRKLFDSYDINIGTTSFRDFYEMLKEQRDLSDESLKTMWKSTLNPPLQENQKVVA